MNTTADEKPRAELKRTLGLPMLICYGVGTMVGGGFYALTGKVAGEAGMLLPWALLAASVVAFVSALAFGELSARMPYSAGEAYYVKQAFGKQWLATGVGWMVIATGVVSAATLSVAFAGILQRFVELPEWIAILGMVLLLGLVTAWGIQESAWMALVITLIETGGLIFVLVAGSQHLTDVPDRWAELIPRWELSPWWGIMLGAYLAFYSFIGFEDLVNLAEEVKEPERNMPRAIIISLAITSVLYFLVGTVTVLAVSQEDLMQADSPLSLVFADRRFAASALAFIGMLAGVNGALVQVVMASRVLYGLAKNGNAPEIFRRVNARTRTPLEATLLISLVVLGLAWWFPLTSLAKATSAILLVVFTLVNLSLWKLKATEPESPAGAPNYPRWLPLFGALLCIAFLLMQLVSEFFPRG